MKQIPLLRAAMPQVFPNLLSPGQKMDKFCLNQSNWTLKEVTEVMLECMYVASDGVGEDKTAQAYVTVQYKFVSDHAAAAP